MSEKRKFVLAQPASKSGGDKYESIDPELNGYKGKPYTVYVHQSISRAKGMAPPKSMTLTFNFEE